MAARINPSAGGKPDKLLRHALMLELNREDKSDGQKIKKLHRLAAKLVEQGINGKIDAIKEIFDRIEGKAPQGIAITGEDGGPIQVTWTDK